MINSKISTFSWLHKILAWLFISWFSHTVHSEEIEKNDECNYYMITQSIIGKPNNMGGTFKVKKIDNFYYVTSYDNMPRWYKIPPIDLKDIVVLGMKKLIILLC